MASTFSLSGYSCSSFLRKLLVAFLFFSCFNLVCGKYYKLLGLDQTSSERDIKKAYRKLSKKYHPDKNPNNKDAKDKFIKITEAYEILSDKDKRRIFDQYGEEGLKNDGSGHSHFHDPFEMFESFFGGGFKSQGRREKKGPPIDIPVHVSLEDLYVGKDIDVEMSKHIICPNCRGSGAKHADDVKQCSKCNGRGIVVKMQQIAPGFVQQVQTTCDACGGKGKKVHSTCPICGGHKIVRDNDQLSITIERGMPDGHKITFEGESDQSPDHAPGDIHVYIVTLPHPVFVRGKQDLFANHTISLLESLVGFEHQLEHLDGRQISISRDSVTPAGYIYKIFAEGMPHHSYPSDKGDMYITFNVAFPDKVSDEAKEAFKKYL